MTKPQSSTRKQTISRKPGRPRLHLSQAKEKLKRKQWSKEFIMAAIPSVHDGTPIYKAAKVHGIPRSTLHNRISGKVKHGTNPGSKLIRAKQK